MCIKIRRCSPIISEFESEKPRILKIRTFFEKPQNFDIFWKISPGGLDDRLVDGRWASTKSCQRNQPHWENWEFNTISYTNIWENLYEQLGILSTLNRVEEVSLSHTSILVTVPGGAMFCCCCFFEGGTPSRFREMVGGLCWRIPGIQGLTQL